uniref:Uncharacterized protein n=1 Tax=Kwoniella bestiolae CBS 10118 TaxID=1296100 RepID=A0A1B9GGJ5_9TREE|nr:hypothetical protein I302_01607 [Kwoniella bestiolae CBS 10118]OCF30088.1 hypothetical protein I302_01607 [Kwoniella bestiolae CBS 10118]
MSSASHSPGRSSDDPETKFLSDQARSTSRPELDELTPAPSCIFRITTPPEGSDSHQEGHKKYLLIPYDPSWGNSPGRSQWTRGKGGMYPSRTRGTRPANADGMAVGALYEKEAHKDYPFLSGHGAESSGIPSWVTSSTDQEDDDGRDEKTLIARDGEV